MDESFPRPDMPPEETAHGNRVVYIWIVVGVATLFAAIYFLMARNEQHTRERATVQEQTPPPSSEGTSTLIDFTPKDVQVNTGWTLLAGRHPSVKFTCRLAPSIRDMKVTALCYRPCGSSEWLSVEVHPHRDRTCRVTLRDLYRDMPYECFFIVCTRDTVIQSSTVRFKT
jgi:hypothetical protein